MAKGPEAFRTISEASDELGVPQHVLRFWETKFSFIRPMKRAGGRRFYRPQDLQVLAAVRRLLHVEGYTIKGVQKLHKEHGLRRLIDAPEGAVAPPPLLPAIDEDLFAPLSRPDLTPEARQRLQVALQDLEAARARIDHLLKGGA
ncbi:MerR family transcriptional regulator [Caulobacter sp. KR2-114]|uniref:MerR family transcriptional regulator n=1 Tax=Caulobacter sp. KR2-114 TaxID=3400912 RepID=UPI003C0FB019